MYPLNQLKTLVSCGRDPARSLPFRRGFLLIPLMLAVLCASPQVQAAIRHTRSGSVFRQPTRRMGKCAFEASPTGFLQFSIWFLVRALATVRLDFNTGIGAGTLLLNTANENTAVGVGALLSNTTGQQQHRMRRIRAVYQRDRRVQQCRRRQFDAFQHRRRQQQRSWRERAV